MADWITENQSAHLKLSAEIDKFYIPDNRNFRKLKWFTA